MDFQCLQNFGTYLTALFRFARHVQSQSENSIPYKLMHYVADEALAITPADVFHSWNLGRSQHCRT